MKDIIIGIQCLLKEIIHLIKKLKTNNKKKLFFSTLYK